MSADDDWTFATQHEYFQMQIEALTLLLTERDVALNKAFDAALHAAETAVTKSEAAANKRFDSVNEFRAQLDDQAKTFLPRQEYTVQHEALIDLHNSDHKAATELHVQDTVRIHDRLDDLTNRQNLAAGTTAGMKQLYGFLVGAAGMIIAAIVAANAIFGGR